MALPHRRVTHQTPILIRLSLAKTPALLIVLDLCRIAIPVGMKTLEYMAVAAARWRMRPVPSS